MRAPCGRGPRPTLPDKNSPRWEAAVSSSPRAPLPDSEEATPEPRPNSAPLNTLLEKEVPPRTMDRSGKGLDLREAASLGQPILMMEEPL